MFILIKFIHVPKEYMYSQHRTIAMYFTLLKGDKPMFYIPRPMCQKS